MKSTNNVIIIYFLLHQSSKYHNDKCCIEKILIGVSYFYRYKQRQSRLLDEEDEIELGYAPTFNLNNSNADVSMINITQ